MFAERILGAAAFASLIPIIIFVAMLIATMILVASAGPVQEFAHSAFAFTLTLEETQAAVWSASEFNLF